MMSDWIVDQLSAICEIEYGTRVVRKKDAGTKFPVYGGGGATFSMDTYNRVNRMVVARFAMSEKCTRFVKGKFFLNDSGLTLTALDKEAVNERFLNYQILSLNDEIYALGRGTAQKNLNMDAFKKITLAYPKSLSEQKQIVSILDEAFEKIEKAKANIEKNIENAKELFQSKLNEVFSNQGEGWENKRLQDVSAKFGRGKSKHRPRNDKKLFGGDYPFVQTGDVRNAKKYITDYSKSYNDAGLAQSMMWPKDTICITIAANIAETAILGFDGCFPDSIIGVQIDKNNVNLDFTYYALQYMKNELQAKGKGAAQDNINLGTFENQYFPFPSLKRQDELVQQLDCLREQIDSIKDKYKEKIGGLEELKKSILQKAFAGELTKTVEA